MEPGNCAVLTPVIPKEAAFKLHAHAMKWRRLQSIKNGQFHEATVDSHRTSLDGKKT